MSVQPNTSSAGHWVRELRQRQRLSQMELSMRVGLSQRHLSCVETGKAKPSRELLAALLDDLDAPLAERNEVMVAAGYAPVHPHRPLHHSDMGLINQVIETMMTAHASTPAMVLDNNWNLVKFNKGFMVLVSGLGFDRGLFDGSVNLLAMMLAPGGFAECMINRDEVMGEVLKRAHREAIHNSVLRDLLTGFRQLDSRVSCNRYSPPALVARLQSPAGELQFVSTFTTFGTPIDITTSSLKIEHMFPADEQTKHVMQEWLMAIDS